MTDQTRKQRLNQLLSSNKGQISQLQNQIKNVEDRLASAGYQDTKLRRLRSSKKCAIQRFHAENKRLEFALADLDYFRFLDLPRELRDLIFQYCLVVGNLGLGPILPRGREPHPSAAKPEWQLLQVNKQIRDEAAKVLLGENTVILNTICWETMSDHFEKVPVIHLDKLLHHFLTCVSIAFDVRNIHQLSVDALDVAQSFRSLAEEDDEQADERRNIHYPSSDDYQHWTSMVKAIHSKNLKEIQIDVTNCYCLFGCHRLVDEAHDAFHCLNLNPKLEKIVVVGTKTKDERRSITSTLVESLLDTKGNAQLYTKEFYPDGCANELGKFTDGIRPKLHFPKFEAIQGHKSALDDQDVEDGLEDEELDLYKLAMEEFGRGLA